MKTFCSTSEISTLSKSLMCLDAFGRHQFKTKTLPSFESRWAVSSQTDDNVPLRALFRGLAARENPKIIILCDGAVLPPLQDVFSSSAFLWGEVDNRFTAFDDVDSKMLLLRPFPSTSAWDSPLLREFLVGFD